MLKALTLTAAITAFSATAYAAEGTPPDLRSHTDIQTAGVADMGAPKTERSSYLENYLMRTKTVERLEDEFGEPGAKIIRRSYATKIFQPIWTRQGAEDLRWSLTDVFAHGILSDDIYSGSFNKILDQRFNSQSLKKQAKADVKLTEIWMRLAKAMSGDLSDQGGMVLRKGSPVIRYNIPTSLLKSSKGSSEREILSMQPEAPQYQALKTSLAQYRTLRRSGGWLAIRKGGAVELGETDTRIPALRTRLRTEGFNVPMLAADADPMIFDQGTVTALKVFQKRHGLEDDGVLGGNTLEALNESIESKINRIAESMYRWRAQGDLGERYIWANIPSYTAEGWNEQKMEIRQRTIVGKERFATPEFSDEVEYLVANPNWYLPVSIIRRQKVPKLKKDPSYAQRYGYDIFDWKTGEAIDAASVDWTEPGVARKYKFVQRAGEGNALGQMKIIFPNQYSVYLHGTPGDHLFDKAQRAFSSGCVRLEDPIAMGKWIARHDDDAKVSTIVQAMEEEERTKLVLDEHVPVHITYMTVTTNDAGEAQFWRDVYDRYDKGIRYVKKYERKQDKLLTAELRKAPAIAN